MSSSAMHFKAGTASDRITPDEPLWLAGYAARTAPAQGKISELYVKALALQDESGERLIIASAEMIAITRTITDTVLEIVRQRHAIERRQLVLSATHTHYAPEFRADKQMFFNIPAEYAAKLPAVADKLVAALVHVIDQALERLEPVRLFARKSTFGVAHNRRCHGVRDGWPAAEDVVDHEVPVLECVDATGRRKAIVFGYACHNTTIPPDDLRYCADWAGFACQHLQQANPAATALFVPGAGADQDPEPRGSVELAQQHGQGMAEAVQQTLDDGGLEISGPIHSASEDVRLPLQPVTKARLEAMLTSVDPPQRVKARFLLDKVNCGEELITSYAAPVQLARIGNELLMIALPGEPVVDWALKYKRESGHWEQRSHTSWPLVWVAGYCNDMFGYLPTRRVQSEGGYEGGRATLWSWIPAPFTDDVEDRITAAIDRLLPLVSW